MDQLHERGATNVVPESFEASMVLAIHLLQHLGISPSRCMAFVDQARKDDYKKLRGFFRGEEAFGVDETQTLRFHNVTLLQDCFAIGKTPAELKLESMGATLIAVRRGQNRIEPIHQDFYFEVGDTVVIEGRPGALINAERFMMEG